jgi:hypothetical protein
MRQGEFFRNYRAALLDYVKGSGESGLALAYELGRERVDENTGLLQVLRVHQRAVTSILKSTPADDRDPRLRASDAFLMEALSTFELVSRGYVDLADRRDRR